MAAATTDPGGFRGYIMTRRPSRAARALLKAPSRIYDAHGGWLLGRRFLRLTHRGRVSGRTYRTVLEVVGTISPRGEVVVVVGLGPRSDWYRNIQASPALAVEIGRDRWFAPAHRVLVAEEAADLLAGYERRNRLAAPILRLTLSRLLGWHYDGGEQARARLTRQLPFIAFRPAMAETDGTATGAVELRRQILTATVRDVGGGAHLVELRGNLDLDGATVLLAEVPTLLSRRSLVVLDAGGLEHVDAAGLHALKVLSRIAFARGARLRLSNPSPQAIQELTRAGADRVIDVRADIADALEH